MGGNNSSQTSMCAESVVGDDIAVQQHITSTYKPVCRNFPHATEAISCSDCVTGAGALRAASRESYVPRAEDELFWSVHMTHARMCLKNDEYFDAAFEGWLKVQKVQEHEWD